MSDTPRTDEIWGSMHGSGYQMMLLAQKLERELAALQKECGTAIRKSLNEIAYREMAEVEADKWLRLCTEWSEANVKLILRAEKAEKERDKHFAASKAQNEDITSLQTELAEAKQENLKLSALVVERDYQITLANKGYDYEGAVEDARHYKEKYLQVCAQHGRLVDQVYEEDGETLKHVAAYKKLAAIKGRTT